MAGIDWGGAVAITAADPQKQANIIDTKAELLWKMNRFDEAIETIEKAIFIEPGNQYFIDQKTKFLKSKQTASHPV